MLPSLRATVLPFEQQSWDVRLYVTIDDDDRFFKTTLAAAAAKAEWPPIVVTEAPRQRNGVPLNENAAVAYAAGAEYVVRVNDDTEFVTSGWLSLGVAALRAMTPPNVGVVGPACRQGNTAILTHDMTHRTHLDMFNGTYYTAEFSAWWADDWITEIYKPNNLKVIAGWEVKHHTEPHGTRYAVSHARRRYLADAIQRGRQTITAACGGAWVISYSLYGSDPRYTDGAAANADLAASLFPRWRVRVYYAPDVPGSTLSELRARRNVDLVAGTLSLSPMVWRFLVASDLTVSRYIVRDIDSRLSAREKAAVDAWVASGERFHVMRDHPSHSAHSMSGGMWGGTAAAFPQMAGLLAPVSATYVADMDFLASNVWPVARESVLQHDAFGCHTTLWGPTHPFPTPRRGPEHVGGVWVNGALRQVDVDILNQALGRECKST